MTQAMSINSQRVLGYVLIGLLLGMVFSALMIHLTSPTRGAPLTLESPRRVAVVVEGEVRSPGQYVLSAEHTVADAIFAAGGLGPSAEAGSINLEARLVDGQLIVIPAAGSPAGSARGLLNLNSATAPELERLPGIGPVLAQRIVDHREEHGPFTALDDLLEVEGIGPTRLEDLGKLVRVP